uniref:Uncharacterized protein n=1 Tax=Onchocerca volvulus TaxID=6282 RepID=A0A8R1Y3W5_ONCVO
MSSSIIAKIQPVKTRLVFLLHEINNLVLESPDPKSSCEQQGNLYIARNQILADKIDRLQLCIKSLNEAHEKWLEYIQTITNTKKRDEEEKIFEPVLEGEEGLFRTTQNKQYTNTTKLKKSSERRQ